jgi:arylsulfatase A-like enzyme
MRSLLFSAGILLMTVHGVRAGEVPRPNVVYFLVDDLGRNDVGFMGGKEIKTPNIDKLAEQGSVLESYYVQPLCSPTRAAFLTGRYPMRYGLQSGVVKPWAEYGLPLEETTLAQDLHAAGYVTGIFGKWHLGLIAPEYLPTRRGFDHQYGHYNGALDYFKHERDGGFDWHQDDKVNHDEGYSTDLIGEHAAEFVRDNAGKRPFFLYVPFNAVHAPYQPPKGGTDEYPNLKGERQNYAAMLTAVDKAIAKVVAAVDDAGVRKNTLFIFSSDNGGPAPHNITDNGKLRGGKGGLYEGGVRVCAFATWDGHIKPHSKNTEPMHIVDWRPTLQKLCGAKPSSNLPVDGLDIWPTLSTQAKSPHDAILLNTTGRASALRDHDWKLIVKREAPAGQNAPKDENKVSVELYNLADDPYEKSSVAEQHPEKVKELRKKLREFASQAAPPKAKPRPKDYKAPAIWGEAG